MFEANLDRILPKLDAFDFHEVITDSPRRILELITKLLFKEAGKGF